MLTLLALPGAAVAKHTMTLDKVTAAMKSELAVTIAAMLTDKASRQRLGEVVFQQKKAALMHKKERNLDFLMGAHRSTLRADSERLEAMVDREMLDELTEEDMHFVGIIPADADLDEMTLAIEIRKRIQGVWMGVSAELDRVEDIVALADANERRRVFVNYLAAYARKSFESTVANAEFEEFALLLKGQRAALNMASVIESNYLEHLSFDELYRLSRLLGRGDLVNMDTEYHRLMREDQSKEIKIAELQALLQQVVEQRTE